MSKLRMISKLKMINNEMSRTLEVIETDLNNFKVNLDRIMNNAEKPLSIAEIREQSNYSDVSGALFIRVLNSNKEIIQSEKQVGKKIIKIFEKKA